MIKASCYSCKNYLPSLTFGGAVGGALGVIWGASPLALATATLVGAVAIPVLLFRPIPAPPPKLRPEGEPRLNPLPRPSQQALTVLEELKSWKLQNGSTLSLYYERAKDRFVARLYSEGGRYLEQIEGPISQLIAPLEVEDFFLLWNSCNDQAALFERVRSRVCFSPFHMKPYFPRHKRDNDTGFHALPPITHTNLLKEQESLALFIDRRATRFMMTGQPDHYFKWRWENEKQKRIETAPFDPSHFPLEYWIPFLNAAQPLPSPSSSWPYRLQIVTRPSILHPDARHIHPHRWIATLADTGRSSASIPVKWTPPGLGHLVLILEGIDQRQRPLTYLLHFRENPADPGRGAVDISSSEQEPIKIKLIGISPPIWLNSSQVRDLIKRAQEDQQRAEQGRKILFEIRGENGLLAKPGAHNCTSWPVERLREVGGAVPPRPTSAVLIEYPGQFATNRFKNQRQFTL